MINDSSTNANVKQLKQQPSEQVRSVTQLIDDAVTAARENADGHEVRISFRDVTENDQPEISSEPMFAGIPMITTNMQEIPIQEKTMETTSNQTEVNVAQIAEAMPENATAVTADMPTITAAQELVAQRLMQENVQKSPIKEFQALDDMVAKMKAMASRAVELAEEPATGDFELDAVLQEELDHVLKRCEILTKEVGAMAEELVKNPPKEPEPKSELRLTVESFFSRNVARAQAYTSHGYHRTREFIGMPVKPKLTPQQLLSNIQSSFAVMNDNLDLAVASSHKLFRGKAVPAM